ncbi:hypothetical protein MPLA_670064 [Mesorhizobium sp. ORS 3359]|nr:hypothetical protein MPLA_670064 [Mesorhizobium sp. ORS 3359]
MGFKGVGPPQVFPDAGVEDKRFTFLIQSSLSDFGSFADYRELSLTRSKSLISK